MVGSRLDKRNRILVPVLGQGVDGGLEFIDAAHNARGGAGSDSL